MNKELYIDSNLNEVSIALLEDKQLVELHKEKRSSNHLVGDVYLGKVRKIMPGLNAAFIDVGYEKDAFLHYLDLGPRVTSLIRFIKEVQAIPSKEPRLESFTLNEEIEKSGKITNVIATNQSILVQIAKEPISTKGPRVTSEISFAGRYLVLMPFSDRISVSQKIKSNEERNRLKRLISSIKPKNFGVIIRTVAENKKVAELDADLNGLVEKWNLLSERLLEAKPPVKLVSEIDKTTALLRDFMNPSFNSICTNDAVIYDEIRNYTKTIAPDKLDIVKLYKGKAPIFEHFSIDKQIKSSFGKTITVKSGIYIIIEHTEAMHVIDVNSGHHVNSQQNQEENALNVNLESATEIARQLRLRDMGGIIVIDFIDMHLGANRRKIFDKLTEEMAKDHSKHTILPPSKFGLVQITRQRVRPEMNVQILEKCPVCEGSGEIKPSIIITDQIENDIQYLLQEQNEPWLKLIVHPFIYAFFTKGIYSQKIKWYFKFKKWISITPDSSYQLLEYRMFNKKGDEIKL